jgi:hypothetical protein
LVRGLWLKGGGMLNSVSYKRHWFPPQIIARAVWLCFRFPLSLQLVEEMLLERGIVSATALRRCQVAAWVAWTSKSCSHYPTGKVPEKSGAFCQRFGRSTAITFIRAVFVIYDVST